MKNLKESGLSPVRNIIWDFNGTLLNDLEICIDSINTLLERRSLSRLDRKRYLEIFTFPVRDYYSIAGFNFEKESFETVAVEFMDLYLDKVSGSPLHQGVKEVLMHFTGKGFRQIILSAMEQEELTKLVRKNGIAPFFERVFGISDHLGGGKLGLAGRAITDTGFIPEQSCLIGDTLHDAEVAEKLGIACILIADGHQSENRLRASGHPVLQSVAELPALLAG
ncbi:HAD hydrolase-like protein [Lentimicrobium sp.]|jgi:phosphoglycolate phosphatase|uniref:HAD family hydrolase n=1 Tax=Lentimicrobium sp. TaxID=2034841 RepID=UPI002CB99A89|nr:HAD hydrolase-like protein [Lentimicrobium sp.]HPF64528.1 HAD hydrolase-like protein [Lentimicrobium sp.]HPJ62271.1 HAD hydrolase-like protein [Lentimicrobium sp.]HRW69260.1 HAD hydrolase-like protein [Lentimicrobium sp.]